MNNAKAIGVSSVIGLIFLASALLILTFGHLHEDAYILFQYSKKLALGQGIVFDEVSGHAEGATDFLWMVLLAFLHFLGLDLGSSAALLNSFGIALISYVILKLCNKFDWRASSSLFLVVFSGGFSAALGGFSTLAYGGFIMLFGYSVIQKQYRTLSVFSLIIPLFRPDGVLIVLGGVLVAFFGANKEQRRALFFYLVPVVIAGLSYFFWRYSYFESLLPLPLLVKAKTDSLLEGLGPNFNVLKSHLLLLIPFIFLLIKKGIKGVKWFDYFAFGLGPLFLLVALSFAHQSQNVGGRFQFPIVLSFIAIFILSTRDIKVSSKFFLAVPVLCSLIGANIIRKDVSYLTNKDYINSFPQVLKDMRFSVSRIAITEAGRFPFWYDAEWMVDLVGLNSSRVVKVGATKVINELNPDLIFVHHAGRFDMSLIDEKQSYLTTEAAAIKTKSEYLGNNTVKIAPEVALNYAIQHNYVAILVQYGKNDANFSHVYFLSPKLDIARFTSALEKAISSKVTYFQSLDLSN